MIAPVHAKDGAKVLLVTGGSRGIGAATALTGASRGYKVCVNYRNDEQSAEQVVKSIRASGGTAIAVRADTSSENDVIHLFDTATEKLGPVTDLVNNAGLIGGPTLLRDLDGAELRRLFEVNVFGYIYSCREAVRRMSDRHGGHGGRIVNVSSVAALHGSSGERVHYAASKGAINSFSLGLAKEVAAEGIRITVFSPGVTETDMNSPERLRKVVGGIPLGRAGRPEEMAKGILWLLSDEAAYCVATNLVMSGGR